MTLEGLGPTIVAVMWVETALALVFVVTRLYCRHVLRTVGGWDDVLLVVSWVFLMLYTLFCTLAAWNGFGQPMATLTVDQFSMANKMEIVGQTFCIIGIATSKATVAVLQLRIVVVLWHKIFLWFFMVTVAIYCVLIAIFDYVQCDPVEHVWNPTIPAYCWMSTKDYSTTSIVLSGWSSVADFAYASLPWLVVWKLQMKHKDKVLICCAMSLGVFAGICGIIRAVALDGLNARTDYTYETVGLILWSSTELMVTLVAVCIPTFRPLWIKLFGGVSEGVSELSDRDPSKGSYRLEAQRHPYLGYRTRTTVDHNDADDKSDQGILTSTSGNSDGIKRRDEVTISYEPGTAQRSGLVDNCPLDKKIEADSSS